MLRLLLAFLLVVLGFSAEATAETRVALVISNSNYKTVGSLPNTEADADALTATFTRIGFKVFRHSDLDLRSFQRALRDFRTEAAKADVSLIYYAGHGMEIDGSNYLIPIDAELVSENAVEYESIPLDLVMLAGSGAKRFRLVILDACRNNPFTLKMQRSARTRAIGSGLAEVEPDAPDTLVAYSARKGTTALDAYPANAKNSPFAAALIDYLGEPGLEVGTLFRKVRDRVLSETGGVQEPFVYGSLSSREFFLHETEATAVAPVPAAPASPPPKEFERDCGQAAAHFEVIDKLGRADLYVEHLRRFGSCAFASVARIRLAELSGTAERTPQPAPETAPAAAEVAAAGQLAAGVASLRDRCLAIANGQPLSPDDVALCERAAEAFPDDGRPALLLGRGFVVVGKYDEAVPWYRKAIAGGVVAASNDLGTLLAQGRVGGDPAEARRLLSSAVEAGVRPATYNLALLLETGRGGAADPTAAARLYERCDRDGDAACANRLGLMTLAGRGVTADPARAVELFDRACAGGDGEGCNNLGWMLVNGTGVARDLARGAGAIARAMDAGIPAAFFNAGWIAAFDGVGDPDIPGAAKLFVASVKAGSRDAADRLLQAAPRLGRVLREAIQTELKTADVYQGAIDGRFGPATQRALNALAGVR